jgi:transcriptional regulator with XRE-family HTH domain
MRAGLRSKGRSVIKMTISAEMFKEWRYRKKIPQRPLAEFIGTTATTISKWEARGHTPGQDFQGKLKELLKMSDEELASLFRNKLTLDIPRFERIGERITFLRIRHKLTYEQIAERFGVTTYTIKAWEEDKVTPILVMVSEIAGFFKVTTRYLERGVLEISEDRKS